MRQGKGRAVRSAWEGFEGAEVVLERAGGSFFYRLAGELMRRQIE